MEPILCPYCNTHDLVVKANLQDYFLTQEAFSVIECKNCGLLFTNPRPMQDQMGRYYQSTSYLSHQNKATNFLEWMYLTIKKYNIKNKYNKLIKTRRSGSILDIGCGTGDFLAYCKCKGWKTFGIEPERKARDIASKNLNQEIEARDTSVFHPEQFDVITLWHVLEHLENIKSTFSEFVRLLKSDGQLVVAVPNYRSYDASYYGKFWAAWDVPRHLYHFDQDVVMRIGSDFGFTLVKVVPMKWDAYYVSLLSEKAERGRQAVLRAIKTGLISNAKACSTMEYSSKIYVFEKRK